MTGCVTQLRVFPELAWGQREGDLTSSGMPPFTKIPTDVGKHVPGPWCSITPYTSWVPLIGQTGRSPSSG